MQHAQKKVLENQHFYDGPEGNRTPVRKPIPCSSTIIVCSLTFPPSAGSRHPADFSSFILRPYRQSLLHVVSYIIDARFLTCRCAKADSCTRQRLLNCLQRLYLVFPLLRRTGAANGFHSCTTPVETSTTPLVCLTLFSFYYYKHTAFGLSSPKLFLRAVKYCRILRRITFYLLTVIFMAWEKCKKESSCKGGRGCQLSLHHQ